MVAEQATKINMIAKLACTMRETVEREIAEDNEKHYYDENKDNDEYNKKQEGMQTLTIYKMEKGAIGMMSKMNIKLPPPTQFDGRYPRNESLP
eukprot:4724939-Amphidinium_carterae.1